MMCVLAYPVSCIGNVLLHRLYHGAYAMVVNHDIPHCMCHDTPHGMCYISIYLHELHHVGHASHSMAVFVSWARHGMFHGTLVRQGNPWGTLWMRFFSGYIVARRVPHRVPRKIVTPLHVPWYTP